MCILLCAGAAHHQALHSFPTRRSSDLIERITLRYRIKGNHLNLTKLNKSLRIARKNCAMVRSVEESIQIEEEIHIVERSEEHTSELQSRGHLVCRLLLEKKKITN